MLYTVQIIIGAVVSASCVLTNQSGDALPPSLAAFSPSERGVLVYTGYGVTKELTFYCLTKKQVRVTIELTLIRLKESVDKFM